MRLLLILITLLLPVVCCQAQEADADDWQQFFIEYMEQQDEDGLSEEELQDMLDELRELARHPLNLNHVTYQQLKQLPFLTDAQVEALEEYLFRYAPMRSMAELRLIPAMDWQVIRLLPIFTYIDQSEKLSDSARQERLYALSPHPKPETQEQWRQRISGMYAKPDNHRNELLAGGSVPFYQRKGDKNGYLGYPYRHHLRYEHRQGQHLRLGVVAAQDAGEPFFAGDNRWGYDHYSAYLMWQGRGVVQRVVAGAFKASFGLGLTINSGISLGKLWTQQTMTRQTQPLRPHASRSEGNHLFGAGATMQLSRQLNATVFASWQPVDATLDKQGNARTLLTSNPHRTPSDIQKRHNTQRLTSGVSLRWTDSRWHVAVNGVMSVLDRQLLPYTGNEKGPSLYRQYLPSGRHFLNVSASYGYRWQSGSLRGETAMDHHGQVATLHTVEQKAHQRLTLTAIHRYYQREYATLTGRSFGTNSRLQNEHGVYLGAVWHPTGSLTLTSYADYAHFAAPRYRCSIGSDAADGQVEMMYEKNGWKMTTRYRLTLRQLNNSDANMLCNQLTGRLRLSAERHVSHMLTMRAQIDGSHYSFDGKRQLGGAATAVGIVKAKRWQLTAQGTYFHTDGYNARLYVYEPQLQYLGGFPTYYDHGMRALLKGQMKVSQRITLAARYSLTHYFNRNTIGSDLQAINGSTMSDLDLQLSWRW